MVLTAVMAFVLSIMGISTLSTTKMIYDRIRAQNAVDAAADAFALWQARGLNMAQAQNDLHYEALEYFSRTADRICNKRKTAADYCVKKPPWYAPWRKIGYMIKCTEGCIRTSLAMTVLEISQAATSTGILIGQLPMNRLFPIVGLYAANDVAKANGASQVLTGLSDFIDGMLGTFGIRVNISAVVGFVTSRSNLPEIYILPLTLRNTFKLNLRKVLNIRNHPILGHPAPWTRTRTCHYRRKCGKAWVAKRIARDYICVPSLMVLERRPWCGWKDTFFAGYPGYTTWVVGKTGENVFRGPRFRRLRWLNPRFNRDPNVVVSYKSYDNFAFPKRRKLRTRFRDSRFQNPGYIALASSQASGTGFRWSQPVLAYSGNVPRFKWARPQLISVHVGGRRPNNRLMEAMLIWH
jgi:hypothetical protein